MLAKIPWTERIDVTMRADRQTSAPWEQGTCKFNIANELDSEWQWNLIKEMALAFHCQNIRYKAQIDVPCTHQYALGSLWFCSFFFTLKVVMKCVPGTQGANVSLGQGGFGNPSKLAGWVMNDGNVLFFSSQNFRHQVCLKLKPPKTTWFAMVSHHVPHSSRFLRDHSPIHDTRSKYLTRAQWGLTPEGVLVFTGYPRMFHDHPEKQRRKM